MTRLPRIALLFLPIAGFASSAANPPTDRAKEIADLPQEVNQPIRFYGRVVDQHGTAVAGVQARLSVRHTDPDGEGGLIDSFSYLTRETDANGRFELSGVRGSLLGIAALEKPGYLTKNLAAESFWYWAPLPDRLYRPDPTKPKIFVLWKSAGAERLIDLRMSGRAPADGSALGFDLSTGHTGKAGDVLVSVTHGPVTLGPNHYVCDWAMTISAPGGLQIVHDAYPYLAAENGYEPTLILRCEANDPEWSPRREVLLYVRTKGHQYARVSVGVTVPMDDQTPAIYVESYLNPSGSRNLEFDEAQNIQLSADNATRRPRSP